MLLRRGAIVENVVKPRQFQGLNIQIRDVAGGNLHRDIVEESCLIGAGRALPVSSQIAQCCRSVGAVNHRSLRDQGSALGICKAGCAVITKKQFPGIGFRTVGDFDAQVFIPEISQSAGVAGDDVGKRSDTCAVSYQPERVGGA